MDVDVQYSDQISEQAAAAGGGRRSLQHKQAPPCVLSQSCTGEEPGLKEDYSRVTIKTRGALNSNIPHSHVEMKLAQVGAKAMDTHCFNTYPVPVQ